MNYMNAKELGRPGWIGRQEAQRNNLVLPQDLAWKVSALKILAKQRLECLSVPDSTKTLKENGPRWRVEQQSRRAF